MLSIDITDRQIKFVRGSSQGNKIKIDEVDFREIDSGLVTNGYIGDIPMVAAEIIDMLNARGIKEKDSIISISSSSIIYRELMLPKPKKLSNTAAVEAMIGSNMGISNEYNISYTIIGETIDENNNPLIKVVAAACPQRLVEGYVKLFSHLGLNLRAVNIANNSISRLVQNTPKLSSMMPLLLVQIDKDFINVNLYDDNSLTFSRFFKIDPADYNYAPDYINQAVYDNLFRMFQFFQSRKDMKPIKELMFYGEINDFVALSNTVQNFNVPCHIFGAPANVVSRSEYEFTRFANAVGALYKINKDIEHINLLNTVAAKESKGLNGFFIGLGASVLASIGLVVGANLIISGINSGIEGQIALTQSKINATEFQNRLTALSQKEGVLANFESYKASIQNAEIIFEYMPKATTNVYKMLREPFTAKEEGVEQITDEKLKTELKGMELVDSVSISDYAVNASFICTDQAQPSKYVRALIDQGYFENITYTGYSVNENKDGKGETVEFTLSMLLKAGNDVTLEKKDAETSLGIGEAAGDASGDASGEEAAAQ